MGLISGMVMGTLVGIAMVVGWSYMMRYRSSKRITKAIDITLLGSLNRDDLKKLCGDKFPEWVSFPAYEQVKWLNKQLSKLWPFISEAATAVVKDSVEPLLDAYRPPGITSLKFNKFTLGSVPPKIEDCAGSTGVVFILCLHSLMCSSLPSPIAIKRLTPPYLCSKYAKENSFGMRVQSLKKGQITMDIDLKWGGDPNIVLAVEALVASLPIQLKNLQVFTILRVIFQLSEEIPCISAVVVALLSEPKPRMDYVLKAVGGSLTAIPGLSDMIDDTVQSIVSDTLQWPHRIVIPLGGADVDTSELELKPQGRITVTVLKASSLKNLELIGKSDPYVVLYVRPVLKVKTKVVNNNLNPVWDETFELIAEDKETQAITIEVLDEDDLTQDKRLGIVKLPLMDLEPETSKEFELRLLPSLDMIKVKDKKDRGTITIKVLYHALSKEEQQAALEEEKKALKHKRKMKSAGMAGGAVDAVGGAASLVGTGVGAGAGLVGSGFQALSKAGKLMGKTVTNQFNTSRRIGNGDPVAALPDGI